MPKTITLDLTQFSEEPPVVVGKYLAHYKIGGSIDLLNITIVPESNHGGLIFEERLGIREHGGRSPSILPARWLKVEW